MFKKTLLALTIASASAAVTAADIASLTTGLTYSNEGLVSGVIANDYSVETGTLKVKLGSNYKDGDLIRIQLSGATFKAGVLPAVVVNSTEAVAGTPDLDKTKVSADVISASASELIIRFTAVTIDTTSADPAKYLSLEIAGTGIKLNSTNVGTKVKATAVAETSTGIIIDVQGENDSKEVGEVIQEHKFTVASTADLNEKIDVADERKSLTALFDTATIVSEYNPATFAASKFVLSNINDSTVKINGSFTGFEKGLTGSDNLGKISVAGADVSVASDLQSGEKAYGIANDDDIVVTFTPDASKDTRAVLNVSDYTADVKLSNGTKTFTYSDIALGSLELNGSSTNFPYTPVGFTGLVTTNFEIANSGTVDGDITLTAFDAAGNTYSKALTKKAEGGKLTMISDKDIVDAFGLTAGAKLSLTITVNSPDGNIKVSGYSNRGTDGGRMALLAK